MLAAPKYFLAMYGAIQDLEKTAPHMVSLVQGYRGGYTKDERRKIEGRLFANEVQ